MAAKGRIWSGPAFVWVGESVRPAYENGVCKQQVQKRPGGNADRTKLGAKAELLGEFERKAGRCSFRRGRRGSCRCQVGLEQKTEQRTGKEHAAWTRSEDACGGASGFSFTDMREERARSRAQGEWQSEMAKRNGKAKWQSEMAKRMAKRNAEQSAARTFPLAFARPRRSPAKFTRSTRIRMFVFAKGFGLINR